VARYVNINFAPLICLYASLASVSVDYGIRGIAVIYRRIDTHAYIHTVTVTCGIS